jgi:Cysteine-rich secretory protein family
VVPYWGYSGYRAEILAVDNQDMSRVRYDYGCAIGSQLTCGHSSYTYAPFTAAQAVRMWMNSSTHRAKMLGSYTKMGCGAWQGGNSVYGGYTYVGTRWFSCIFANSGPSSYKDLYAPTVTGVTVGGVPYLTGMTVTVTPTVRFTLTDTGGPTPRVSDWWAYLDGNSDRTRAGFREGAFDAVGGTAAVSFTEDLSTFTAGAHTLTLVGRGMDTRTVSLTLSVNLVR